ncbi:MAG TPA: ATP synthase F0 subunit B [Syntrophorhabdaceae bacterium]|jgi:F-type H+-transporting ATPase subunit b
MHLSEPLKWTFQIANFLILVGLLVKFGAKPFKEFFLNRHNRVKEQLEEADRLVSEASAMKSEYEARLARLDSEIDAFKAKVAEETARESQKLLEEGRAFAARIQEQARMTYEQELREVAGKVKGEIAKLVMEKAETLVTERFGKGDNDKMVEEFIEKLRSLN